MEYRARVVEKVLTDRLNALGGVLLQGARGCGKTSTGMQLSSSYISLDSNPELVATAEAAPEFILQGETPRFIDEWQLAPNIWNVMRHRIDRTQEKGQFLISGSAVPADDITRHSGIGRISIVKMRPMTLSETGVGSGEISLSKLVSGGGQTIAAESPLSYEQLALEAVRGGWPALLGESERSAMRYNREYLEHLQKGRASEGGGAGSAERIDRLLKSMARRVSEEEVLARLTSETAGESNLKATTVRADLDYLQHVFAYEPLPAWSVQLSSRIRVRQKPKMHFVDPSLAAAAMNASAHKLALQGAYFGRVFESMVVRDVRTYVEAIDGKVFHYRDEKGLEIDLIVDLPDGWAAIEVKLGSQAIPAAEQSLLALREKVDDALAGENVMLAVVTGTQYAYTLPSGVHVIPLACLGA